jgi:hypothetical protein
MRRRVLVAAVVTVAVGLAAPAPAAALPSPGQIVSGAASAVGNGVGGASSALGGAGSKLLSTANGVGSKLGGLAGKAANAACSIAGKVVHKWVGTVCSGAVKAVQTVGGLVGSAKSNGVKAAAGAAVSTVAKAAAGAGIAVAVLAGLGHGIGYLDGQLEQDLTAGPNSAVGLADLRSGPFGSVYAIAAGIAVLIAMGLFLMSVAEAAVVGSGRMMTRSTFVGLPKATVGMLAAPVLVVLFATALDQLAGGVVSQAQGHVHEWFSDMGHSGLAHVTEWVLSGVGDLVLLPALLVAWVELALRKLLLAVILVFLPLAMAGEVHPRFAHWGPPIRRVIIGLLFIKLLVALMVLLGSALPDITSNWLLHLLGGGILLGLAAYSPFFLVRHAPMAAELTGGGVGSHREDFARHGPLALDSAGMAQYLADLRSSDVEMREETRRETQDTRREEPSDAEGDTSGGKASSRGEPSDRGEADPRDAGTRPAATQPPKRGEDRDEGGNAEPAQRDEGANGGGGERAEPGRSTGHAAPPAAEGDVSRVDDGDAGRRASPGGQTAPDGGAQVIRLAGDQAARPPADERPEAGAGRPGESGRTEVPPAAASPEVPPAAPEHAQGDGEEGGASDE